MKMRRGDTKKFKFVRQTKDKTTIMEKADELYVTFKYGEEDEALFQKSLDNGITFDENTGYYHVTINPEDTENLPFVTLVYDIERTVDGEVLTPIVGELEIQKEVTYKNNKNIEEIQEV